MGIVSTNYHTPIPVNSAANATTWNTVSASLDAQITANTAAIALLGGSGATVSDAQLKEWTEGEDYEITAATYDSDNVVTTATVQWPDGSAGTFTTTVKDTTWLAINGYTITHTVASKTVTQATITRDANGNVTVKPALTVA